MAALFFISAGVIGWYVASKMAEAPEKTADKKTVKTNSKDEVDSLENNSLLVQTQFLFAKTSAGKTEIFRRPPGKDESVKVLELPGAIEPGKYSRLAQQVAFVAGSDIYTSKDGGLSFQKIYSAPSGGDITSIRFSKHDTRLAIAVAEGYDAATNSAQFTNTVFSMNSDGTDQKKLFTSPEAGVYIRDWSLKAGVILYQSGCNRCNQVPRTTELYNLETKKTTTLPINDNAAVGNLVLNNAATRVTYTIAQHDPKIQIYDSLSGSYYGPPYSFYQYDIKTKKDRIALRIGKKVVDPKSSKDIPAPPVIATASTQYGRQHYYLYQNTISLLYDDNSTKNLLTISGNLREVLFVSEAQVLAIVGTDQSWELMSFDPKNKTSQALFKGENSITPLGMSDQF